MVKRTKRRNSGAKRRLTAEVLEDRRMLTIYSVTTLANSGAGSLRTAVDSANSNPGVDQIIFSTSLHGETITLLTGSIQIADSVHIEGPGAGVLSIDAGDVNRVFLVDDLNGSPDKNVTISGLELRDGVGIVDGGAIFSNENLTLDRVVITNSYALRNGGAVANLEGNLTITNSTIHDNFAAEDGGGIAWLTTEVGQVTITNSTISGNLANNFGGGLFLDSVGFAPFISHSTITGNTGNSGGPVVQEAVSRSGSAMSRSITRSLPKILTSLDSRPTFSIPIR